MLQPFLDPWLTGCACVAVIRGPAIKRESWSATLHLFGLVDRRGGRRMRSGEQTPLVFRLHRFFF